MTSKILAFALFAAFLALPLHAFDYINFQEVHGERFEIFSPAHRYNLTTRHNQESLVAPPERFVREMRQLFSYLDTIVDDTVTPNKNPLERAQQAYVDFLFNFILGFSFGDSERTIDPALRHLKLPAKPFDARKRTEGVDFTFIGMSMAGAKRLRSVEHQLAEIRQNNIPGMVIETGVWRGGMDIFVRGILRAYHQAKVPVLLCDSFHGLPPGNAELNRGDMGWDRTPILEIDARMVAQNFVRAGLMDDHVLFAKGFFNDSMPTVAKQVQQIALLRLDGDMYASTVDVVYHLYEKVVVGGFVVIDDWTGLPAQVAMLDFFATHNHHPEVIPIDRIAVYWKKHENDDFDGFLETLEEKSDEGNQVVASFFHHFYADSSKSRSAFLVTLKAFQYLASTV
eukprot:gene2510-2748_t